MLRYKPIIRKRKFIQTIVYYFGEQIQLDLVDIGKYKNQNKGYYWILTGIEILRRSLWHVHKISKGGR